jgi:hypothetical protein
MINLKQINKDFSDFRNAFGGNQIDMVNPMQTLPMIIKECHHNVTKRQLESGGRSILGFNFMTIGKETFINHHSVWEMQNGSIVDVTLEEPCAFLPIKYFDANVEWYFTNAVFRFIKDSTIFYANPIGLDWIERTVDWLQTTNLETGLIHHRKYSRLEDESYREYLTDNYSYTDETV